MVVGNSEETLIVGRYLSADGDIMTSLGTRIVLAAQGNTLTKLPCLRRLFP